MRISTKSLIHFIYVYKIHACIGLWSVFYNLRTHPVEHTHVMNSPSLSLQPIPLPLFLFSQGEKVQQNKSWSMEIFCIVYSVVCMYTSKKIKMRCASEALNFIRSSSRRFRRRHHRRCRHCRCSIIITCFSHIILHLEGDNNHQIAKRI